jgi:hypothetical protein
VASAVRTVSAPSTVGAALAVASSTRAVAVASPVRSVSVVSPVRAVAVASTLRAALAVAFSMRAVSVPLTLVALRVAGPRSPRLAGLSGRHMVALAVRRAVRVRLVLLPLLSWRDVVPMSSCEAVRRVLLLVGWARRHVVFEVSEREPMVR